MAIKTNIGPHLARVSLHCWYRESNLLRKTYDVIFVKTGALMPPSSLLSSISSSHFLYNKLDLQRQNPTH